MAGPDRTRIPALVAGACTLTVIAWWASRGFAGRPLLPGSDGRFAWMLALALASWTVLGMYLLVRGRRIPAAVLLGRAICACDVALLWFAMRWSQPELDAALAASGAWRIVADSLFGILFAWGSWLSARFWTTFPAPLDAEGAVLGVERHFAQARFTFLPRIWRATDRGMHAALRRGRLALWRVALSPRAFVILSVFAVALAVIGALPLETRDALPVVALKRWMVTTWVVYFVLLPPAAMSAHRMVSEERRAKLTWAWVAMQLTNLAWLPSFVLLALPLLVFLYVAPGPFDALGLLPVLDLALAVTVWGISSVPVIALAGLAACILYSGSLDPRLVAGRITLWTLLAVVLTGLFVLVERAAVLWITATFGLDPITGALFAGAVIAGAFQPLRRRTEAWVRDVVAAWLPASYLTGGSRTTGAIVVSDIAGYTALSGRSESDAVLASGMLQKAAREAAGHHDGAFVKSMGDGVLLRFPVAADAVAAVHEVHAKLASALAAVGLGDVRLHSGVHFGPFNLAGDGDVYGQTVNIASRIADRATAGEILISRAVSDQLEALPEGMKSLGPQAFKNVAEPVECLSLA